jgi:hypothetical protein
MALMLRWAHGKVGPSCVRAYRRNAEHLGHVCQTIVHLEQHVPLLQLLLGKQPQGLHHVRGRAKHDECVKRHSLIAQALLDMKRQDDTAELGLGPDLRQAAEAVTSGFGLSNGTTRPLEAEGRSSERVAGDERGAD